jgi:hypothetical protein
MPSVSEAQRRKMALLFKQGRITKRQWEDFKVVKKPRKKGKK